jgi:opacity protein-like surface antigen
MVCRSMISDARSKERAASPQAGRIATRSAAGLRSVALCLCLLLCGASVVSANSDGGGADGPRPSLFMLGPQDIGLAIGYGHGFQIAHDHFEEGDVVSALIVLPHWQITLTRQPIDPRWYKGRLQFRAEATMIANFQPRNGFAGGLALLLRYSWNTRGNVRPYFQIGAGFLGLDLDIESDQIDGFAFQPQGGIGVVWRLGKRHAIDFGVRYQHISNAFTRLPNGGIDTMQYTIGYAYHFSQ